MYLELLRENKIKTKPENMTVLKNMYKKKTEG